MKKNWTTITFKELAAQKHLRLDAGYWLKKKQRQAASHKRQAASCKRQAAILGLKNP